jgi:internalin A
MSEKKPNEPMIFSCFADWYRQIDSLSESARHTVKVLLNKAGTDDAEAAEQILSSMTELDLSMSFITDISSLSLLTNLTKLHLQENQISDISFLASLTHLTTLILASNQISDISSLASLTHLTTLILGDNQISDISSLASLTNLTSLHLQQNQISDISSLGSLTNLTSLHLQQNQISDISSLGSLTNLTSLRLDCNQISDISSLGSLTNLTTLDLNRNQISDISSLGSLTNLTTLILNSNKISDISSLGSLTNLTSLRLDYNQISDISSLGLLTNLARLEIRRNKITDISVLRKLRSLRMQMDLSSNPIPAPNVSGELAQKHLTLSTRPINAEKATAAVKIAYAAIDLEEPEVIVCSSPREAFLQIFNLSKCDLSQNSLNEWNRNIWREKLASKWMSSLILIDFVSPLVWEYEFDRVTIDPEADSTLSLLMNELVDKYKQSVPNMGQDLYVFLWDLKSPKTPTTLLKEIYLTELYISLLGINLSQKEQEILRSQKQLLEECGFIFAFEKICAVCDRPRHLRFDSQNRLHAEGEPAIEFADGWNFYYYHGVKLPENYGKVHPSEWQSQWLLTEDNAELRRVLIQGIGYDRIIQELAAEQIDSWQEYALLKIDNADVEPIYLLKMTCPSTGFIHALRVPFNLTSAREAIGWVNGGIDPEEFSVQT